MIAIRTYAISPEYCAMMTNAYNEIIPDDIIENYPELIYYTKNKKTG